MNIPIAAKSKARVITTSLKVLLFGEMIRERNKIGLAIHTNAGITSMVYQQIHPKHNA